MALRARIAWHRNNIASIAMFDQFAKVEKRGFLADTGRPPHPRVCAWAIEAAANAASGDTIV